MSSLPEGGHETRLAATQRAHWEQTYTSHPDLYGTQPSEAAR